MPTNWEMLKEKGNEEYKKKNYLTAINYYTQALDIDRYQDVLFSNRALCYLAMNKIKQAMFDFKNCLEINPRNMKALVKLYQLQTELGNFGDAETLIQRCINLCPKDNSHKAELKELKELISKYDLIAELYSNKSDFKKCELLCKEVLNKCLHYENLKRIYIECLIINFKFTEAINFINKKVSDEEKAQTDEYFYLTALSFYHEGKYENSRQALRPILQRSKDERFKKLANILNVIEVDKEKANVIFKKGDYDKAFESYSKLLELDPENKNFCSLILANRALCKIKFNIRLTKERKSD